jgi:hypothetical protein
MLKNALMKATITSKIAKIARSLLQTMWHGSTVWSVAASAECLP